MNDKQTANFVQDEKKLREKPIHSSHVFDGKLLQVYYDEAELPDGTISSREWIKHPGASAIVPVFEDGTIMLVKQFRYPPRKLFIEVPAGKLDPGETPIKAAKRELLEESGLSCQNIMETGSFYPAIGYADEIIYSFAAWGLTEQGKNSDDDEFLLNYRLPFTEAMNMIAKGHIKDGKTICTLMHVAQWWRQNGPFNVGL